jgi:intracellular sulfur oxidation DsrE/DsrF family protein
MKNLHILIPAAVVVLACGTWAAATVGAAPQATFGPVLENYGPVYYMGPVDLPTPTDRDFRGLFDVAAAGPDDTHSPAIETVARFLNMHAQAGVPRERLGAALVLHGGAGKYALTHAAYRERYGVDNPNLELIEELRGAGVEIVICGQTAGARGFARDQIADAVGVALSAMTAHKLFQDQGYQIVAF